ncbi:helix-turn-helix domain-containing protein [Mesorhizobium sp. B2-6-3]|uniref:helix-turn-helix domain-containing protein n=1 Tax=Mesorhizobium sp. B2-6-3 TaxID=2589914 RepID=UPI00112A32DE|nr:helix-turn-helix domain-containing protein [Mesorhizobium sp. B2-6-3]TPJ83877.1 helix-turn-helix domain-containing protein [Mesorhizobium sp. B2-6-3]
MTHDLVIPCRCCGRPLVSQLTIDETIIAAKLAPTMAEILRILTDAKGHWVSSAELVDRLYPNGGPVEANGAIRVHVHHMRKLLATAEAAFEIDSHANLGRRMIAVPESQRGRNATGYRLVTE